MILRSSRFLLMVTLAQAIACNIDKSNVRSDVNRSEPRISVLNLAGKPTGSKIGISAEFVNSKLATCFETDIAATSEPVSGEPSETPALALVDPTYLFRQCVSNTEYSDGSGGQPLNNCRNFTALYCSCLRDMRPPITSWQYAESCYTFNSSGDLTDSRREHSMSLVESPAGTFSIVEPQTGEVLCSWSQGAGTAPAVSNDCVTTMTRRKACAAGYTYGGFVDTAGRSISSANNCRLD